MSLSQLSFESVCAQLINTYTVKNWWPAESCFEVLVGAVLVQNTRWTNVEKAITCLREQQCLDPENLSHINPTDLQNLIRSAGCQSVKARRLMAIASWVVASGGLELLETLTTTEMRDALLNVHGIGEETADAILCFGFARRVFIADKYARTWLLRMGLVSESAARRYSSCRQFAESALAGTDVCMQDLHAAIVVHVQSVCHREPKCCKCTLKDMCSMGSDIEINEA
jgi:endonuclease III related protein